MKPFVHVRRDGTITTVAKSVDANSYKLAGVSIVREIQGGTVEVDLTHDELIGLVELTGTITKRVRK